MRNFTSLSIAALLLATVSSSAVQAQQPLATPRGVPMQGYGMSPQQAGYYTGPGHPYLDAPLYSSPVQHVPYQVGGTVITNQALYPQEMLYPHKYYAMYPPFYYKVKGRWIMTKHGVKVRDDWYLQGTEVKIEYKDHFGIFSNIGRRHFN